jgi:AraC family transcriptional regulator of adaptative response/methylated-DNA-[protein]-cysteine methyltransferase
MPSLTPQAAWNAVLHHDRRFDAAFVYAVSSTKVYCRPSCPSRRPVRSHVTFFRSPELAEAAGFRACRRCRPRLPCGTRTDQIVEDARRFLDEHADEAVTLRQLAARAAISPFHLQRAFTRVVGCSPKAYQTNRRMERFTALLKRGESVTTATYEAGFGSSSRLYERVPGALGMTPSVFRSGGTGVTLRYAIMPTAVGRMLIAMTERGIAAVRFGNNAASLIATLRREYPNAILRRDPQGLAPALRLMLGHLEGNINPPQIPLDMMGTVFQRKVWKALQRIPRGSTRTYREIALAIGRPMAARAVARACATNPIALAIPCHRVVRENGRLAGYRWGVERKKRLLALEQE